MLTPAVMGLDLSLVATGLADTNGGTEVLRPGPRIKGYARNHVLAGKIIRRVRASAPDVVVLEGYSHHSAGAIALIRAAELGGHVRTTLTVLGYPWVEVPPSELKKWATGNGAASKDLMVEEALKRGAGAPITHDEADAYLARAWGLAHLPEGLQ